MGGMLVLCLAHSLSSLLGYLKKNVAGKSHREHDVAAVRREMGKWFPRAEEYAKYVHWDMENPLEYTRNVVYSSPEMEVLVMCWPAGAVSSIHCHDESSCWVAAVEGKIHEVQYSLPKLDKKFLQAQLNDPKGAVGRCGPLRVTNVVPLGEDLTETYANNDIGLHRMENRSDEPAITLHIYAPRLQKMTIYKEAGDVSVMTAVATPTNMSEDGELTGLWGKHAHPDGVIDVKAWNSLC